jgi:hypothetical protein
MKIIFVSSANKGGISTIVKLQGESLVAINHSILYFGIVGKGFWGYFSNIVKLRKYIIDNNPDLVHAHYSLSGIVAGLTFSQKPLVVSLMGSDTKSPVLVKIIIHIFALFSWDAVIVKTHSMKKELRLKKAR